MTFKPPSVVIPADAPAWMRDAFDRLASSGAGKTGTFATDSGGTQWRTVATPYRSGSATSMLLFQVRTGSGWRSMAGVDSAGAVYYRSTAPALLDFAAKGLDIQ